MAISSNNFATYLEQYLKTINAKTGAKLTASYAVVEPRYQIHCGKCDVSITANRPDDTSFDYSVQEFIKLHTHCTHEWDAWGGGKCKKCGKAWEPEACVHDWFLDWDEVSRCKKCHAVHRNIDPNVNLKGEPVYFPGKPSPAANVIMKNIAPGSAVIDDDPENAEKIKAALEKYNKEMKKKLDVKVAELQAKSKLEKAGATIGSGINAGFSGMSPLEQEEMIEEQKAKQQALLNILQLMDLKDATQFVEGQISGKHKPPPTPPKPKPLAQPTGRKFR